MRSENSEEGREYLGNRPDKGLVDDLDEPQRPRNDTVGAQSLDFRMALQCHSQMMRQKI
jgi:hypothetical protein